MDKKSVVFLRILFVVFFVHSAIFMSAGNPPEKGAVAEINFGLTRTSSNILIRNEIGMIVDGRVGYKLDKHWIAGAMIKYENIKSPCRKFLGFGAYGHYRFNRMKRLPLTFFIESYALYSTDRDRPYAPGDKNKVEVGFVPGLSYTIPKTPLDVKLRYLFIGYNNENKYLKSNGGCLGRGDWVIDAGLRRLELGLAVTFPFPYNKPSK